MKSLVLAALMFLIPAMASASVDAPRMATDVEQVYRSTMTCASVLIASATAVGGQATQIITSTGTLWGSLSLQNKDTSANAYISDSILVASSTANGVLNQYTGFELAAGTPGGSASFVLAPGQLLYAVNDSGSRATVLTICKGR